MICSYLGNITTNDTIHIYIYIYCRNNIEKDLLPALRYDLFTVKL